VEAAPAGSRLFPAAAATRPPPSPAAALPAVLFTIVKDMVKVARAPILSVLLPAPAVVLQLVPVFHKYLRKRGRGDKQLLRCFMLRRGRWGVAHDISSRAPAKAAAATDSTAAAAAAADSRAENCGGTHGCFCTRDD